jgi:hypothetical protein
MSTPESPYNNRNPDYKSFLFRLGSYLFVKGSELRVFKIPNTESQEELADFTRKLSNISFEQVLEAITNTKYANKIVSFEALVQPPFIVTEPLQKPLNDLATEKVLFSCVLARVHGISRSSYLLFDEKGKTNFDVVSFAVEPLNDKEVLEYFNSDRVQTKFIIRKLEKAFGIKFFEKQKKERKSDSSSNDESEEEKPKDPYEEAAKFLAYQKRAYRIVPVLKDISFLKYLDWRNDVVQRIVNYGGVKDHDLVLVQTAHLLKGSKPTINAHALTVTPPGTGKTTFYEMVGKNLGRVTAKSFLGFAKSPEEVYPGIISGLDLPINIDEIDNEGAFFIAQHLNNILEFGRETIASGAVTLTINCSSVFNFSANPVGASKDPVKSFGTLVSRLSYNPAIGRRIALILYISPEQVKDFKKISSKLSKEEEEEWRALVSLFRMVEEYAKPKIERIISLAWPWLNERMEFYEKDILDILAKYEGELTENVYDFFRAHVYATTRIRAAALFISIANNLDKIALEENVESLLDEILEEAEEVLPKLININKKSVLALTRSLTNELESAAKTFYEVAPEYFQAILEASEVYRRSEPSAIGSQINVAQIPYTPTKYEYLSKACDRVLRRKKKEELFEEAKHYFNLEYFTQNNNLFVLFHEPTPYCKVIKPEGSLTNGLSKRGEIEKSEKLEKSKNEEKSQEKSSSTSQVSGSETRFSISEKMEKSQNRQNFENLAEEKPNKVQEPKQEKEAVNFGVKKINEKVFSPISQVSPFLNTSENHNEISQEAKNNLENKTVLCDNCWRELSLEEMKRYDFVQEVGVCSKCDSRHYGVYVKRGEKP